VDVSGYARIFPPTREVTILDEGPAYQVVRLLVEVNGELNSWVSRRDIDADRNVITYRQVDTAPIVGSMGGQWRAFPFGPDRTQLVLTHDYRVRDAVDGRVAGRFTTEEAEELLNNAVERNSVADLDAVKRESERLVAAARVPA
jgi:hypothetical protein